MDFLPVSVCFFVGLVVAQLSIPLIQRYGDLLRGRESNFHHNNKASVSRLGGLALALAFVAVALSAPWFATEPHPSFRISFVLCVTSLAMFGLGFWDDLKPLGARKKFVVQLLIASLAFAGGIEVNTFRVPLLGRDVTLGWLSGPVTVFWLISLTNLVNLIDGIDGLAAGVGFMLMSLLVVVGVRSSGLAFSVLYATGMAGALLGFLRFNFPPARIYMGDGGAYFIGFVIGVLTIVNSQKGTIVAALLAPLFALALPIIDVATAILRRGVHGLPIFRADRKHLHHRLLARGLSRRKAVAVLYVVCLLCLGFAFAVFCFRGVWLPFLFGAFCLTLLLAGHCIDFGRDYLALGRVLGNSIELRKESRYALPLVQWLGLESERVSTIDELCDGFQFICRKFRFSRVLLHGPIEREWTFHANVTRVPPPFPPDEVQTAREDFRLSYDIPLKPAASLEFTAPAGTTSQASFELLSELAAEAWFKAIQRWQQLRTDEAEITRASSTRLKAQTISAVNGHAENPLRN